MKIQKRNLNLYRYQISIYKDDVVLDTLEKYLLPQELDKLIKELSKKYPGCRASIYEEDKKPIEIVLDNESDIDLQEDTLNEPRQKWECVFVLSDGDTTETETVNGLNAEDARKQAQQIIKMKSKEDAESWGDADIKSLTPVEEPSEENMKINKNTATNNSENILNEKLMFSDSQIQEWLNNLEKDTNDAMGIYDTETKIQKADDAFYSDVPSLDSLDIDDTPFMLVGDTTNQLGEPQDKALAPVAPGPDTGVASVINSLIRSKWEAIDMQNSSLATIAAMEGNSRYSQIAKIISDIIAAENLHIGQLQRALEEVSPNVLAIEDGRMAASEQIEEAPVQSAIKKPFVPLKVETFPERVVPSNSETQNNTPGNEIDDTCTLTDIDDDM